MQSNLFRKRKENEPLTRTTKKSKISSLKDHDYYKNSEPVPPFELTKGKTQDTYKKTLAPLLFNNSKFDCSHYPSASLNEGQISRIKSEINLLKETLSPEDSIFIRVDELNLMLMKIMIIGGKNTPYENGVYFIDLFFNPMYPVMPPKIIFKKRGPLYQSLNPHFENNGKVSLSILNTSDKEDFSGKWSTESTILNVLQAIRTLFNHSEPLYFNKGLLNRRNNCTVDNYNLDFNIKIKKNCFNYAMMHALSSPPEEFKSAIDAHFALKSDEIILSIEAFQQRYYRFWRDKLLQDYRDLESVKNFLGSLNVQQKL